MTNLTSLIEPEILAQIDEQTASTEIKHKELELTHNRFDLAFKLYFLQGLDMEQSSDYRELCYKQHIKAFSEGTYSEPNNSDKNSYQQFKIIFETLFNSIKIEGFDANKSLIPLAQDGSILNGAHRTAATIFFAQPASVLQTQLPPRIFDYLYFKQRGVPTAMLDAVAQTFIEYDPKCFLAIIWPAANGHDSEVEKILAHVVYKKSVKLNYNGAHNILAEAYQSEPWLGDEKNNFPGIKNKLVACFSNFKEVKVCLFKAENLEQVLQLKEQVRDLFNIGKHSIHITDSQEETLRLGRLLLNDNGVHFLNYALPRKFLTGAISAAVRNVAVEIEPVIWDERVLMNLYGLQKHEIKAAEQQAAIDNCFDENSHDISELIDHPKNYFWYKGRKYMALKTLLAMKVERKQPQDIKDIALIKPLMTDSKWRENVDVICCQLYFKKIKFITSIKLTIAQILIKLGLFDLIKKLRS